MATSLKITDDLKYKIQQIANSQHRSPHSIMCEAIRKYVEIEEAHEAFKQEALASWEHYQETGLHLTKQEVQNWLNSWGTDNESEAPQCHK